MKKRVKRLAAIDVGTNSIHLIVVEFDKSGRSFEVLEREKEMVRLGEGGMGRLSPGAIRRGVKTLKRFKAIADAADAPVRAVATSAVREASNRKKFLDAVKKEAGIAIEVASGKEEARLIYSGVLSAATRPAGKALVIDIGGGSTEFIVGSGRRVAYAASLKLGAVRLTRRFFDGEKIEQDDIIGCREHVEKLLGPVATRLKRERICSVIGTSGTIVNLARMMRLRRGRAEKAKNGGLFFSYDELFELTGEILAARDAKKRVLIGGLDPGRADIITAGVLILAGAFKKLGIGRMTVSRAALREGIVADTAGSGLLKKLLCARNGKDTKHGKGR